MYIGLLATHSYLRYIILLVLIIVIVLAIGGLMNKGPFTRKHDKLSLFLMICAHIQLILGLILYIIGLTSDEGRAKFTSETMKNADMRYFAVEHVLAMIVAITFITVARVSTKKTPVDQTKHKRTLAWNLAALVLIVVIVFVMGGKYNTY